MNWLDRMREALTGMRSPRAVAAVTRTVDGRAVGMSYCYLRGRQVSSWLCRYSSLVMLLSLVREESIMSRSVGPESSIGRGTLACVSMLRRRNPSENKRSGVPHPSQEGSLRLQKFESLCCSKPRYNRSLPVQQVSSVGCGGLI